MPQVARISTQEQDAVVRMVKHLIVGLEGSGFEAVKEALPSKKSKFVAHDVKDINSGKETVEDVESIIFVVGDNKEDATKELTDLLAKFESASLLVLYKGESDAEPAGAKLAVPAGGDRFCQHKGMTDDVKEVWSDFLSDMHEARGYEE